MMALWVLPAVSKLPTKGKTILVADGLVRRGILVIVAAGSDNRRYAVDKKFLTLSEFSYIKA